MVRLVNGCCNEVMDRLIEEGVVVDAVITDPPYLISRKNNFHTMKGRKGLDFGSWDWEGNTDILTYIEKSFQLLKKGGNLVLFTDFRKVSDVIRYAEGIGFQYKKELIYVKSNPMPRNINRRPVDSNELILWFCKPGAKWTFNRQAEGYERSEFKCAIEKGLHKTQKPIPIMSWLVRLFSNESDTILDPFSGSGTTGVSAINNDRKFIGIERDEKYYEVAKKRLDELMVWKQPK